MTDREQYTPGLARGPAQLRESPPVEVNGSPGAVGTVTLTAADMVKQFADVRSLYG